MREIRAFSGFPGKGLFLQSSLEFYDDEDWEGMVIELEDVNQTLLGEFLSSYDFEEYTILVGEYDGYEVVIEISEIEEEEGEEEEFEEEE
jgi:hypothetical protein